MIIDKKIVQLSVQQDSNIESPFKDGLSRKNHTPYGLEFKRIQYKNNIDYGNDLIFNIPKNSDLLHRCYFELSLPNFEINDSIINKINKDLYSEYLNLKNNKNIKIENELNYWNNIYDNFKLYANIQNEIYVKATQILEVNNFTIDYFKNKILADVRKYTNYSDILINIDSIILNETNIIDFINNFSYTNFDFTSLKKTISENLNKKYDNIKNYLEYVYYNKNHFQKKYDDNQNTQIFYKWIDNLSHYYFTNFSFYINGNKIDSYSNDYLNIYQTHTIDDDQEELYKQFSRNNDSLYETKDYNKIIYTPLIFFFNEKENATNALPIVALQNSNLSIRTKINELTNLIYFKNWEELFYKNLNVEILRKYHSQDNNNNILEYNFSDYNYESVELKLPENIYIYKFKNINKIVLENNYDGIDADSILNKYGNDDENGNKVIDLNNWNYMMDNIKDDKDISESSKIILLDYHYFIDYNYLLNIIPKPNVNLLIETGYLDDIEKFMFSRKKLEYLVKTHQEVIFDITNNSLFDSLNDISGLIKDLYFFIQPKVSKSGTSLYSKSELSNYDNFEILNNAKVYENLELSISNEYNLLQYINDMFNKVNSFIHHNNEIPDGVIFKSFGFYSNYNQPSGSINLSNASGQNFLIEINNELFNNYINNINNPNKLGFEIKLMYVKYNLVHIENGGFELLFYN